MFITKGVDLNHLSHSYLEDLIDEYRRRNMKYENFFDIVELFIKHKCPISENNKLFILKEMNLTSNNEKYKSLMTELLNIDDKISKIITTVTLNYDINTIKHLIKLLKNNNIQCKLDSLKKMEIMVNESVKNNKYQLSIEENVLTNYSYLFTPSLYTYKDTLDKEVYKYAKYLHEKADKITRENIDENIYKYKEYIRYDIGIIKSINCKMLKLENELLN
jgi:hypothetical protein